MKVANTTPKASETAMGTRKAASELRFVISGASPTNVVTDVRRIGLKRETPASRTAVGISTCAPALAIDEVDHDQAVVDDHTRERDQTQHRKHGHI